MEAEVYSWQLMKFLQAEISHLPANLRDELKAVSKCGCQVKPGAIGNMVHLVNVNNKAHFSGPVFCDNRWYCPRCTTRVMAENNTKIMIALDHLKKQGFKAFMVTVTIPHVKEMSIYESTNILYNTWNNSFAFGRTMTSQVNKGKRKGRRNPFMKMMSELKVAHHVKVCEYTWGINGWHPHFHMIFWLPGSNLNKVLDYEESICQFWQKRARIESIRYWTKNNLHGFGSQTDEEEDILDPIDSKTIIYKLDAIVSKNPQAGFWISKNENAIVEVTSGNYLTSIEGTWGGNDELTKLQYKKAKSGHFTPHQLLQAAYQGDRAKLRLYIDFALAMHRLHRIRVSWSQTGIRKMIKLIQQTEKYLQFMKKKRIQKVEILCSFSKESWYNLLYLEKFYSTPLRANILYLAEHNKVLLWQFLNSLGIKYSINIPELHKYQLAQNYSASAA